MMPNTVNLRVAGVVLDKESDVPFVLLRDSEGVSLLMVPVGPCEASSIIMEVEGIKPTQLLTHDLLAELFIRHRYRLEEFALYDREAESYLGRLHYRKGLRRFTMEVRPSDGIALALRLGAPILAAKSLTERSSSNVPDYRDTAFVSDSVLYLGAEECGVRL